jgi:hypothetical protein
VLLQVVIAVGLLVAAAGVAWWLNHREVATRPVRPTVPVPQQLDRTDFARADAPWLVVLFSSATCDSCAPMAEKVRALESADVAVVDVPFPEQRALHERYAIDAVPIVVVVDHQGVTRASFTGNASATDLWAAVADLRRV